MLLHVLRRPGGALLSLSPVLLFSAAIPGAGLLLLGALAIASSRAGETALLVFLSFFGFLFAVMAYAFWSAASSRVVRCRREGQRLLVEQRGSRHSASAPEVKIEVTTRKVGWQRPLVLHEVTLAAGEFVEPITIHSGLTRWGATQAAARVQQHLGAS